MYAWIHQNIPSKAILHRSISGLGRRPRTLRVGLWYHDLIQYFPRALRHAVSQAPSSTHSFPASFIPFKPSSDPT